LLPVKGSAAITGIVRRKSEVAPDNRRTAGQINTSPATMADTGLPGTPIHGVPRMNPNAEL
jgi:hypothetical protein